MKPTGSGLNFPLRQGANDLAIEDAIGRFADLDVGHGAVGRDLDPCDHLARDAGADRLARVSGLDAELSFVLLRIAGSTGAGGAGGATTGAGGGFSRARR
jgi:hypothetical protein